MSATTSLNDRLAAARSASRTLAVMSPGDKVDALEAMARALASRSAEIIAENAEDVQAAR